MKEVSFSYSVQNAPGNDRLGGNFNKLVRVWLYVGNRQRMKEIEISPTTSPKEVHLRVMGIADVLMANLITELSDARDKFSKIILRALEAE